jgi:hypothetical protein
VQAGTIGHDIDVDVLVLGPVMFDDVGGVVQHQIHHLRIVLVDLDRDAMRLGVGGNGACGESDREQGGGYIAKHQELSEVERTSILVIARSKATKQSILSLLGAMDCFAEPVIGRAFARPVGSQ